VALHLSFLPKAFPAVRCTNTYILHI
jgi:hypothetical protein